MGESRERRHDEQGAGAGDDPIRAADAARIAAAFPRADASPELRARVAEICRQAGTGGVPARGSGAAHRRWWDAVNAWLTGSRLHLAVAGAAALLLGVVLVRSQPWQGPQASAPTSNVAQQAPAAERVADRRWESTGEREQALSSSPQAPGRVPAAGGMSERTAAGPGPSGIASPPPAAMPGGAAGVPAPTESSRSSHADGETKVRTWDPRAVASRPRAAAANRTTKPGLKLAPELQQLSGRNRVDVELLLTHLPADGMQRLRALGFEPRSTLRPQQRLVGRIRADGLRALAALDFVRKVEPVPVR